MEVMPPAGIEDAGMQLRLHRIDENRMNVTTKAIDMRVTDFIVRAFLQQGEDVQRHVSFSKQPAAAFAALKKTVNSPMSTCPDWSDSPKGRKASRKLVEEYGANGRSKIGEAHHSSLQSAWRKSSTT